MYVCGEGQKRERRRKRRRGAGGEAGRGAATLLVLTWWSEQEVWGWRVCWSEILVREVVVGGGLRCGRGSSDAAAPGEAGEGIKKWLHVSRFHP